MPRDVKPGHRAFPEEVCAALDHRGGHPHAPGHGGERPHTPGHERAASSPTSVVPPRASSDPFVIVPSSAELHEPPVIAGSDGAPSRFFHALDPRAAPSPSPERSGSIGVVATSVRALAFASALLALALVKSIVLRVLLPLALAVVALLVLRRSSRGARAAESSPVRGVRGPRRASRGLELDGHALLFCTPERFQKQALLAVDAAFGVTLLASPRRDRLIALLTSASGTYTLGASFDAASRRAFAPLLDRACTVVGDDVGLEAIGPDGEPLLFAPEELASLLDALIERCTTCLDRFVLTDARGAPVTLDGRHLCIGDRAVDLNAPLEWKPIVFQEALGGAVAVYQGTWIRQSGAELVLVSLLPALGPVLSPDLDAATLDRAVQRDLRLMQASPEPPPPNEQRVAIERLFMLPVRGALDRAPRASQEIDRASA
jgi:hypothetical protein